MVLRSVVLRTGTCWYQATALEIAEKKLVNAKKYGEVLYQRPSQYTADRGTE